MELTFYKEAFKESMNECVSEMLTWRFRAQFGVVFIVYSFIGGVVRWEDYIMLMTVCDFQSWTDSSASYDTHLICSSEEANHIPELFSQATETLALIVLFYLVTFKHIVIFFLNFSNLGSLGDQGSVNITQKLVSKNIWGFRHKTKLFSQV